MKDKHAVVVRHGIVLFIIDRIFTYNCPVVLPHYLPIRSQASKPTGKNPCFINSGIYPLKFCFHPAYLCIVKRLEVN
jgi:hypothetical protein